MGHDCEYLGLKRYGNRLELYCRKKDIFYPACTDCEVFKSKPRLEFKKDYWVIA